MNFAKLNGADIFATGTWNGLTFDEAALDGIVSSFDVLALSGKVPLKLGHGGPDARDKNGEFTDPLDQLAMGWVTRVWRQGRTLMADLDVPQKVFDLIKEGYLKFVSVELLKNVKASTREIPWVLDAVALLGSDSPAVGVLKDLQALTMSRSAAALPHGGRVAFARADRIPFTTNSGDKTKMSEENKITMQELLDKMAVMQADQMKAKEENAVLKAQIATFSQTRQELTDVKASNADRDRKQRRAELAAVFEAAIANEDIVPAARERFGRVYKLDDDEAIMSVTLEDAKQFVRENPNPLPRRKAKPVPFSLDRADGDVPPGTQADVEALMRATALLAARNVHAPSDVQLTAAVKEVFTKNPELGNRYKFLPDQIARNNAAVN
jgi:hypothetical protein